MTPAKAVKAETAPKPVAQTNGAHGKATPASERGKASAKPVKAEVVAGADPVTRTPASKPEAGIQGKGKAAAQAPKREIAKRETPKAATPAPQPQQASLLPTTEKSPAATPRRDQKLAAVTSVKRPAKK
jgi:hypothetical protein